MRLSELVNINITDIHDDGTIRIVGKGNKERLVYLNDACNTALRRLCDERAKLPNLQDKKSSFCFQAYREAPFRAAYPANCGQLSESGGFVWKRIFRSQIAAHGGDADVSGRPCGYARPQGDFGPRACIHNRNLYHMGTAQLRQAAQASPFAKLDFEKAPEQPVKAAALPKHSDDEL